MSRRIAFVLSIAGAVSGCNAIAGIDAPTDRPSADAARDGASGGDAAGDAANDRSSNDTSWNDSSSGGDTTNDAGPNEDAASEETSPGGRDATDVIDAGPSILGTITRVSVDSMGTQGDNSSEEVSVSGDGQLIAFESSSTNLVYFDDNMQSDIFVHELATGKTSRVSIASNNDQANAPCSHPRITADGNYVYFTTRATNFAATAMSGHEQVFSRWLAASMTDHRSRLTDDDATDPAPASDLNHTVAFETASGSLIASDTNGKSDIYAVYGGRGQGERISISAGGPQPDGMSTGAAVSADGMLFAFVSYATNLVAGDTNGQPDIFVRGLTDRIVSRVSVSSTGDQANAASGEVVMSANGKRVAFSSGASNLVPGDNNSMWDVFVHDLELHKTFRVSVSSSGEEGDAESSSPSLSGDGNLVAFSSRATNLVPGDVAFPGDTNYEDIFVHDMMTGKTIRLTTAPDGKRANGDSTRPAISSNGRVVAFISTAPNLVAGDSNGYPDAFVFQFTSPWP